MKFTEDAYGEKTFRNLSIAEENAENIEFSNCLFDKCDFTHVNFSGGTFIDCKFVGCNLTGMKVEDTRFQEIVFDNCKIMGVDFSSISTFLLAWEFSRCKVNLCDFTRVEMKFTRFIECGIKEKNFIS